MRTSKKAASKAFREALVNQRRRVKKPAKLTFQVAVVDQRRRVKKPAKLTFQVAAASAHENQNVLRRPWQRAIAAYEVRDDGIYHRKFGVRLATFAANTALLRHTLSRAFDAAHEFIAEERDDLDHDE